MNSKPHFLILTGYGINCEKETAIAFADAGARTSIKTINQLSRDLSSLNQYQGLVFPGGFSFADDLGSGQVLAIKLRHQWKDHLHQFLERETLILGVCNGFQVLMRLGLLPFPKLQQSLALVHNSSGHFIDKWIELEFDTHSPCIWTKGIQTAVFPVRHGEGRVQIQAGKEQEVFSMLTDKHLIPLRYKEDVNGSFERIAGLCDESGRVFALMPHPEAASHRWQMPSKEVKPDMAKRIFQNAVEFFN